MIQASLYINGARVAISEPLPDIDTTGDQWGNVRWVSLQPLMRRGTFGITRATPIAIEINSLPTRPEPPISFWQGLDW